MTKIKRWLIFGIFFLFLEAGGGSDSMGIILLVWTKIIFAYPRNGLSLLSITCNCLP